MFPYQLVYIYLIFFFLPGLRVRIMSSCQIWGAFFKKIYSFIYLFLAVLGLRFCVRAFSSCGERGLLLIAVRGPLTIAASPVAEHGSRCAGSVVVAHGPSRSAACGILPDQGSNPCPLHRQADSQPLRHQGSPPHSFYWSFHIKFHAQYQLFL